MRRGGAVGKSSGLLLSDVACDWAADEVVPADGKPCGGGCGVVIEIPRSGCMGIKIGSPHNVLKIIKIVFFGMLFQVYFVNHFNQLIGLTKCYFIDFCFFIKLKK
jgi:hypothetical protein